MSEMQSPTFMNWIKEYWAVLSGIVILLLGILKIMFQLGRQKEILDKTKLDINNIGKEVERIKLIIPNKALEEKTMLLIQTQCDANREACESKSDTKKLIEEFVRVRQALSMLVKYNDNIPKEESDKITKDMIV